MSSEQASKTKWTLRLFGKPRVTGEGHSQALDQFGTKRAMFLLARLALSHQKALTRTDAAEFLWPDDFFDATRLRLRQELTRLRRGLGPARDIIQTDEEWLRLANDDLEVDVWVFERVFKTARGCPDPALREKLCLEAVALSDDEFLKGHEDGWIDVERSRLAEMRYVLLVDLADLQANRGDHESALQTAKTAVLADPLQETGHLIVMQQLGNLGRLSDALGQYQQLKRILRDELAETPSAVAEQVATALRQPVTASLEPRSVGVGLHFSIPAALEPIYGREEMLGHLCRLLSPDDATHRLVSLNGPGGIGKTRLAMQVAALLQDGYAGRVGWISLADISDAANIPLALASELGVTLGPNADPMERISALLPREPLLLVLDNLEQLVPEGITYIRALAEARPNIRLLMTTRVALNLGGERAISVGPLPLPKEEDSFEQPAMRVFLDPLFAEQGFRVPGSEELAVLRQIAEKLEGIPLALQLASGRLRTLDAGDLLQQLDKRLDMVNRRVDAPERHRTIRAAIAGSFLALEPEFQKVMGRLSVFRGGWNQAAAAAVCGVDDPLPFLEGLMDYSLVRVDREDRGLRFRMLETIRDYVAETIPPDELALAHSRHADWLIQMGRPEDWRSLDADSLEYFKAIDMERDNIREAAKWCLENDLPKAVALGAAYGRYWASRSLIRESVAFYTALFEHQQQLEVEVNLARASYWHAQILFIAQAYTPGDVGLGVSQRTMALCDQVGLEIESALCLLQQSRTSYVAGDYETCLGLVDQSEARLRELNCPEDLALTLQNRAMVNFYQGKVHDAISFMEEAVSLLGRSSTPFHEVQTSMMLAFMYLEIGDIDKSKIQAYTALEKAETYGVTQFTPMIQEVCGRVAQAQGDLNLAVEWYGVSASGWGFFGNVYQYADLLHLMARVHLIKHEPKEALPLLETSARMLESRGIRAVLPNVMTTVAKANLMVGEAPLAARLMGAVKKTPGNSRDGDLATEIAYVAEIIRELEEVLGADELSATFAGAPDIDAALREAFA